MGCIIIKIKNFYNDTTNFSGGEKEKILFFLSLPHYSE